MTSQIPIIYRTIHRHDSIIIYPSFELFPKRYKEKDQTIKQKETPKFKGEMSARTKRIIGEIIYSWAQGATLHMVKNRKSKKRIWEYMNFITLTLSAKQKHPDNIIKRELLNYFLIWLKRSCGVDKYLWVGEKQKNGSIHFHIVVDKAIGWKLIRQKWNKIQNRLGYIDEFERKHKHRDPNSTDIHTLEKIDNIALYLTKYMTKAGMEGTRTGRLWSCSRNIRNLKYFRQDVENGLEDILEQLIEHPMNDFIKSEYINIIKLRKDKTTLGILGKLKTKEERHYLEQFERL